MLVIVKMKGANFIKSAIFEKAGQMIIEEVKKKTEVPPRVEYRLSSQEEAFKKVLDSIEE